MVEAAKRSASPTGYSGTPLAKKLGIREGHHVVLAGAPAHSVATDITEGTSREVALPLGFVDVKVCAIDETWSGLKLVVRKALR